MSKDFYFHFRSAFRLVLILPPPHRPSQREPGSVPGNKPTGIFLAFVGPLQFHTRNNQNTILERNCYARL